MSSTGKRPGRSHVTVLGAGLMGRALVRTFAAAGLDVSVWNRTHETAERLADDRVHPIRSAAGAVRAAPLVVVCLTTYEVVRALLDDVVPAGAAIVNLTSGTPEGAEELAAWADAHQVRYLDGAILAFPDFIGEQEAIIAYSGSSEVWDEHGESLALLAGGSCWIGEDVGTANVFDAALILSFYTTAITSYVEAATYALDRGIPEELLRSATSLVMRTLAHSAREATTAIARNEFTTDEARLSTYAVGARSALRSMRNRGVPARLLQAAVESLSAACEADLGHLGIYAQAETMRRPGDAF